MTDRPPRKTFADKLREIALPEGDYLHLPDPDRTPDTHTRTVITLHNQSIMEGHCPSCGGAAIQHGDGHYTVDHESTCPAHIQNLEAYLAEHEIDHRDLYRHCILYVREGDGTFTAMRPVHYRTR